MQHVAELEAKIKEMQAMSKTLKQLATRCSGNDRPECPILEDIARQKQ